jgi:hypothetical protein
MSGTTAEAVKDGLAGFIDRFARLVRADCYLLCGAAIFIAYTLYTPSVGNLSEITNWTIAACVALITIGHTFKWLLTGRA